MNRQALASRPGTTASLCLVSLGLALTAGTGAHAQQAGAAPPAFTINAIFDASINNDPNAAAIKGTINAVINDFQSRFSDPIVVTIIFGERTSGLGVSLSSEVFVPYNEYLSALINDRKTNDDATALAHLPAFNPV